MKITNKYGLPGAIVEAIKNDSYTPGEKCDISVTQLISPPQLVQLHRTHRDEIEEDASDRIWALMGQAVHTILERSEPSAIVEKRLYGDFNGWRISGQFDRMTLREATLQDYKFASVWELINGLKPDRVAQLNILAELAIVAGHPIKRLEIVHIARDWSKQKARFDSNYPQSQVQRVQIPLWTHEERVAYINERVAMHQAARGGEHVPCTDDDRWMRGDKWAVMKVGRKTALRVLGDSESAKEWAESNGADVAEIVDDISELKNGQIYIQHRKGEAVRCESYCAVADFCAQYKGEESK